MARNKGVKLDCELTENQAKFVKNVVQKNMTYVDAYKDAYNSKETNRARLNTAAQRVLNKPHVREAIAKNKIEVNKGVTLWNKEKALVKLLKLLNKAEEEIDIRGLSKTSVDAMLGAIKELNAVAGLNFKDQKKYEIDLAQLEIARLNYQLSKQKVEGPDEEEMEDDGFMDAISLAAREVWCEEE